MTGPDLGLAAAREATTATYDAEAVRYAALTGDYSQYPGLDAEVAAFHAACPAGSVLDAGSGAGRDAALMSRLGRAVVAVDISGGLLRLSARRRDAGPGGAVMHVRGDIAALPLTAGAFAGVWMCASLLHIPTAAHPVVLAEALRVLRPGGLLAVSMKAGDRDEMATGGSAEGPRWLSEVDPDAFADRLVVAGFPTVTVAESGRGKWFVASGVKN